MSSQSVSNLAPNYNPKEFEQDIYQKWQQAGVGNPEKQVEIQGSTSGTYTNLMPPPNLTGDLHAGHAFGHYLMDTLTRIHRQKGEKSLWLPGVDHAGIQLEGVIDKAIKAGEFDEELKDVQNLPENKEDIPKFLKKNHTEKWLELAWKKANEWRDNQAKQSSILGDIPDHSRNLFTLDKQAVDTVNFAFKKYYEDGLIYKKSYLINWSVGLQTALSDVPEDIGYEKRKDPFVTFEYRLFKKQDVEYTSLNENILVSTVRPETIFADEAVAVHPEIINPKLEELVKNRALYAQIPLTNKFIPVILALEVERDFGTGALKITPAHDLTDYNIFNKYLGGEFEQAVGRDGRLTEICGEFAGMTVMEGRKAVIDKLIETGYVPNKLDDEGNETEEDQIDWNYEHNVTICERSKTVVEPLISEEFFLGYDREFVNPHKSGTKKEIKNLVFDLGDVVFWERKHFIAQHLEEKYSLVEGVDYNFREVESQAHFTEASPYTIDFWQTFAKHFISHQVDPELLLEIFIYRNDNPHVYEQTERFIKTQKAEGKKIYYLTNRHEESMLGLKKQEILGFFDGGLGDYEIGISKPDKRIYQIFIEKFNLNPAECVFVDDRFENIETAQKLNFETIHFNPKNTDLDKELHGIETGKYYTTLQDLGIEGVEETNYYPNSFQKLGVDYVSHIKDWCISRDLVWGHKMPIWYNLELNPEKKFYTNIELLEHPELQNHIKIQPDKPTESGNWVQEEKILDTWFSSCLWPLSTLDYVGHVQGKATDFDTFYPTQDMVTAREIFYAWIVRMTVLGKYFTGKIPFQNVVITPTIQDEQGKKMSKSLKNGLGAVQAIERFSSDSLRMAMLGGMIPNRNMRLGGALADRLMEKYRNFGNKVWNITRFLESKEAQKKQLGELSSASVWIKERFVYLQQELEKNLQTFELTHSINAIYTFLWDDFADWYVEYLKTDETQLAFAYKLFRQFIITLSPYLPFETQAIWEEYFAQKNLLAFEKVDLGWHTKFPSIVASDNFAQMIEFIQEIRSVKGLYAIDPVQFVDIFTTNEVYIQNKDFIKFTARANVIMGETKGQFANAKYGYSINILDYIKDRQFELGRTKKLIESLEKQIGQLESQLSNQKFIDNADPEAIDQKRRDVRDRFGELEAQKGKLEIL
jgi:HAD superfamily hydrolase (TIGR01509 family)